MGCELRIVLLSLCALGMLPAYAVAEERVGDERTLRFHIAQGDIESGEVSIEELVRAGQLLFSARFTTREGAGRPGATGAGIPTRRPLVDARQFIRTSGPDANSCAGCHNDPEAGGGGDIVANVFVGAAEREPVLMSISPLFSAERGTTEMHGSGLIELLAREMTADLHRIRAETRAKAVETGKAVRKQLISKDVEFGHITALPDGTIKATEVEGVDKDLVIRPWSQKGTVTSLRTFTVTALNQHHGMQAVERFGVRRTGAVDFDRDGVLLELTEGDISALVLYQATLPPPRRVVPSSAVRAEAAQRGEKLFEVIGCADCHRPALTLNSTVFAEPGPYNLEGTQRQNEVKEPVRLDLLSRPWGEQLERATDGKIAVRAFTDLKRHHIADAQDPFFANELVSQGFTSTDEFITRRLWGVGNSAPYGHAGNLTTIREAILHHAGEARGTRLRFENLGDEDQNAVVEFLLCLRVEKRDAQPLPGAIYDDPAIRRLVKLWETGEGRGERQMRRVLARVNAALERAKRNLDRCEVLLFRIEHERERAGLAKLEQREMPQAENVRAYVLRDLLGKEYEALVPEEFRLTISSLEKLLGQTAKAADEGVLQASFAHAVEAPNRVGRIDVDTVAEQLRSSGASESARWLGSWCDELAFRSDQYVQRAALAATRAEAEAMRVLNRGTSLGTVDRR